MPARKFSVRGTRLAAALTAGVALSAGVLGLTLQGPDTKAPGADQVKAAAVAAQVPVPATAPATAPGVPATPAATTPATAPAAPPAPEAPVPSGTTAPAPPATTGAAAPAAPPASPGAKADAPKAPPAPGAPVAPPAAPAAPQVPAAPPAAANPPAAGAGEPSAGNPAAAVDSVTAGAVRSNLATVTTETWTAQDPGPVRDIAGHDISLNECANVRGALTWQQQPYQSGGGNPALLESYSFASEAAATTASEGVRSGMTACQDTSRVLQSTNHLPTDAVAQQTASATDAAAFRRTWTGVEGISARGTQTNHLYVAARGTRVLVLHFTELATGSTAAPYDVAQDPNVLSLLTNLLADQAGAH
ncbi:hypothetical protein [Kitasatospora sp. NPDC001527]|uniref:hypothetical protein n=1 Tax=Kitasatospora sp. NPDC001527 TaxID=3154519 RepID=UPI0033251E8B